MGCNACCPDDSPLQFGDLATDEFCGNFDIPCGQAVNNLWVLDQSFFDAGAQTAGTVSVYFEGGCSEEVQVTITRMGLPDEVITVPARNTRSISALNLTAVGVNCLDGDMGRCRGKYCINLHYDVLVATGV
ncbi:S-Ena type endospore appendage [Sutcliffiella horikoshii]|uniref:S-Ena type endospore appendage n=1 Tax=Sutcliffiella horikoshii TaxID=79883 RepID=UPI00384C52A0